MTLRHRLLAGLVFVGLVLVLTNLLLARTSRSFLLDRIDRQLVDVASRPVFRQEGRGGPGGLPGSLGQRPPRPAAQAALDRTLSEFFIAVESSSGVFQPIRSAFADDGDRPSFDRDDIDDHVPAPGTPPEPFTVRGWESSGRWRLVVVDNPREALTVIGLDLRDVDATVARLRSVGVAGTLLALGALAVVTWWIFRLGIRPVESMTATAEQIAGGDLSHRVSAAHAGSTTEAARLGTALNAMLDRIEEAFRAQRASEERVRRFAADASHELRTPLTSIRGYAELYRTGALREPAEMADAMRRVEQEAARMGSLVEDLLLLARLDRARPAHTASVRLDHVAADAVSDALAVEPDRPIDLTADPVTVEGDEASLRQVAANLLTNARVHTAPGTPVHVRVEEVDGLVRLSVTDEGPGMTPDVAAHVFERFYRADGARARTSGGSGLGLSIVAAVAEAHGGTASVASKAGEGATFVVEVPGASARDPGSG